MNIEAMDGLVSFWDFQEKTAAGYIAKGPHPYRLQEMNGELARKDGGILFEQGKWLRCPRSECPELNIHGPDAQVTVAAWVNRSTLESAGCEAVAGMWDESRKKRQYCLFLNLLIWDSAEQVCGHVSSSGGPTPGYKYCMTSSIGGTPVTKGEWHFVAFTYDGVYAKSYLDGRLDARETYNPYEYREGLYDGGEDGADFTVGAVDRSGEIGNFYRGLLGGLAVFNRALSAEEIRKLNAWHPPGA